MNTVKARLYVCGDCANKIKDAGLPKGAYRCPLIVKLLILILFGIPLMLLIALKMGDIVVNIVSDMAAFYG